MSKRRGNNEGSLYERPNGKWRGQITLNGNRISKTFPTRKEAQKWLLEIRHQIEAGLTYQAAKVTFGEFLQEWLATKQHHVAVQTHSYYAQCIRDYIEPTLGKTLLRDLTSRQIQLFYNEKVMDGVGLRTIQKCHTIIHACLNSARKFGMIPYNPDDATHSPKPKSRTMKFLTQEQVKVLLKTSKANDDRFYALYYLALVTGMRIGELLALRWNDIDLNKGIINVNYNLKRLPNGGGLVLDKPKTKTSIRAIKIGHESIQVLRDQKVRNAKEREQCKNQWKEEGFVFPSRIGTALDSSNMWDYFKTSLKNANLPDIRFHDLRHTAASLMLNNGVDVLVASQRLGHAKPSITLDVYGHLMPNIQNEAASLLDALISD